MSLKNSQGFTTVEIIIVAALISFLTGGFVSKQQKLEKQIDQQEQEIERCERLEDFLEETSEEME